MDVSWCLSYFTILISFCLLSLTVSLIAYGYETASYFLSIFYVAVGLGYLLSPAPESSPTNEMKNSVEYDLTNL